MAIPQGFWRKGETTVPMATGLSASNPDLNTDVDKVELST
jgi:hypothetical protein